MSNPTQDMTERGSGVDYQEAQNSVQFRTLKSRHRRFVLPVTAVALVWYGGYTALAVSAESFMSIKVLGNVTMGIVLGLLQIVTTFLVTLAYVAYANQKLDPAIARLRAEAEVTHDPDQEGTR
ncbi:DUF485 domain-containing protein [Streptomyces sp. NL15-2K]|uniref:DUF485 domain-containing protein n=1 Tax=Streptomyces sp. NL15-2K TaxID=376149 RepID=UPI000F55A1D0|nr:MULTISPECIES: DUF485 domain-containing protein [Actinomycetes]WKX06287.1 DUF485 domain-containing protein [Kutzneria buriramensis]GCB52850.1 hypothetical protein SNL152K_10207 [Streptomyces sp. NL15-2K]